MSSSFKKRFLSRALLQGFWFFCFSHFTSATDENVKFSEEFLRREHSLMKPFQGSGMVLSIPNWEIFGNSMVTKKFVRLTNDVPGRRGSIWNLVPVEEPNWEMQLHFKIHGKGKVYYGDGLAFWYVQDKMVDGPVFGSKDQFYGLGVFIDTYMNDQKPVRREHPIIQAVVNNGTLSYDHEKDGKVQELKRCPVKVQNLDHETYLSVRYEDDTLTVAVDVENKQEWTTCFSENHVRLPTGLYLGLSAATGDLSDNHDIFDLKFYALPSKPSQVMTNLHNSTVICPDLFPLDFHTYVSKQEDRGQIVPSIIVRSDRTTDSYEESSGWSGRLKKAMLWIFGILALLGVIVTVLYFYGKEELNSRKRFY
ncbi:unnamed protein product [Darwinula stevensoni]|uniref:L-type lectin-like domain-containing protein n=1 Tax=Darwinula stevensoni TaxID=69355 RepID=A0A7R8XD73_9CRUS|nr:unnamed protein product [Darwinula stevensoni]CAG0886509.1 unnamed protein product [Darwinula stevensoni]